MRLSHQPSNPAIAVLLAIASLLVVATPTARSSAPAPDLAVAGSPLLASQDQAPPDSGVDAATASFLERLRRIIVVFLVLSAVALVLLVGVSLFLLWRAKQLVENAVKPDLPALEKLVAKKRRKHPEWDDRRLARSLVHRQAVRAGLVGFVTGLGGLPTLPVTIPIDLAMTIRIQSSLVHLLRLVRGGNAGREEISDASLWLITTGGQELTAASGKVIQRMLVKYLSKSVLKFLPLLGGVVGFALNWTSTQALGRLTIQWLDGRAPAPTQTGR